MRFEFATAARIVFGQGVVADLAGLAKPFGKRAFVVTGKDKIRRAGIVADLEGAGFLKRIERTRSRRGKISNEYDLSGLVEKLRLLEPQFREVAEEAKARKKAVSTPGYKPTKVKAAAA